MSQNIIKNDTNDARKRILQYANNVMHDELAKNNIVVVAIHNRSDPRKFTIVADSEYDKQLEGVSLIFEHPEDFKTVFPDFARPPPVVLSPNMELNPEGVAIPIHKDPYEIMKVLSFPLPDNPQIDAPENVLDDDVANWAVDKVPASLLMDLGKDSEIGTLWVKWGDTKDKRQYKFTVGVATEEQWSNVNTETGNTKDRYMAQVVHLNEKYSSGEHDHLDAYRLVVDKKELLVARYIILRVFGNTKDSWAKVNQVKITKAIVVESDEKDNPI
jgi:hypothetical protein